MVPAVIFVFTLVNPFPPAEIFPIMLPPFVEIVQQVDVTSPVTLIFSSEIPLPPFEDILPPIIPFFKVAFPLLAVTVPPMFVVSVVTPLFELTLPLIELPFKVLKPLLVISPFIAVPVRLIAPLPVWSEPLTVEPVIDALPYVVCSEIGLLEFPIVLPVMVNPAFAMTEALVSVVVIVSPLFNVKLPLHV